MALEIAELRVAEPGSRTDVGWLWKQFSCTRLVNAVAKIFRPLRHALNSIECGTLDPEQVQEYQDQVVASSRVRFNNALKQMAAATRAPSPLVADILAFLGFRARKDHLRHKLEGLAAANPLLGWKLTPYERYEGPIPKSVGYLKAEVEVCVATACPDARFFILHTVVERIPTVAEAKEAEQRELRRLEEARRQHARRPDPFLVVETPHERKFIAVWNERGEFRVCKPSHGSASLN